MNKNSLLIEDLSNDSLNLSRRKLTNRIDFDLSDMNELNFNDMSGTSTLRNRQQQSQTKEIAISKLPQKIRSNRHKRRVTELPPGVLTGKAGARSGNTPPNQDVCNAAGCKIY